MTTLVVSLLLLVTSAITYCDGVQFYKHPVPIPKSSSKNYPKVGQRSIQTESSWDNDPAVQFFVNNAKDGTYHFGFDTGGSPSMYREEIREKSGRVTGRHAYIDPDGILRVTEYTADAMGYRSAESQYLLFDTSDLQLIGPIPKPSRQKL